MVDDAFNHHSEGRSRGISVSSRIAWSMQQVPGQPEIYNEILFQKAKQNTSKKNRLFKDINLFTCVCSLGIKSL